MVTVSAAIGLHLDLRKLLSSGARAIAVGGGASMWMASLTLAMVTAAARGAPAAAALIGVVGVLASYVAYRASTGADLEAQRLRARFESGAPLSLAEATRLLDATEREGPLEDGLLRRTLAQLYPSIGELIPVRESPLPHGEGCRWVTYWEGRSGWALVAVAREPGSATPIHAHPHRLLGKAIEGVLEELRFAEDASGGLTLTTRQIRRSSCAWSDRRSSCIRRARSTICTRCCRPTATGCRWGPPTRATTQRQGLSRRGAAQPTTRSVAASTISFMKLRCLRPASVYFIGVKAEA